MLTNILVSKLELEDCNGNLKALAENWRQVPTLSSSPISKSSGLTPGSVKDSLDLTKQVSGSWESVLENSVRFFESMGIAFEEADEAASQHINTITG